MSEDYEQAERFAAENPIEAAIRTISLPPDCWVYAILWVRETGLCYAQTNTGDIGEGKTIDQALRVAQRRIYDFQSCRELTNGPMVGGADPLRPRRVGLGRSLLAGLHHLLHLARHARS